MPPEARRKVVLELIAKQGFASLGEIVSAIGVSESTVRRDVESLDQMGLVKRIHGGAVLMGELRSLPGLDERAGSARLEKAAIGRATADLISDGESVLLDGGTTTLEVARALAERHVQIVTNSLPIAQLLAASKSADLILIGGYVYPRTGVALGPLAMAQLKDIHVQKTIMGAGGITSEGVFNHNLLLVETQRAMIDCGEELIFTVDRSKFGRRALSWLCPLERASLVVTDSAIAGEQALMLDREGVKLVKAAVALDSGDPTNHEPAPRIEP